MNRPSRLLAILAIGVAAVVGTATWFERADGDAARARAQQACTDRGGDLQKAALVRSTNAQRVDALTIAAAEPLVQRLWGGSAPPFATRPGEPGLSVFPKMLITDRGPLGPSTIVNLRLASALPKGTYRWRTMSATYRNDCWADGFESVTIQDADGDAGASGLGQPYSRLPVVLVEVSLAQKRVFSITPNGGEPATWRRVGRPERLVTS